MAPWKGIFLPIVTPFYENRVDYESYVNLLNFYKDKDIAGIIPLGTTGESPCVTDTEFEKMILAKIKTWKFNAVPDSLGSLNIRYPFEFYEEY